jgi:hypothetical protein
MKLFDKVASTFSETFLNFISPLTGFIWVTCILVATLAGPFGTFAAFDWQTRLLYWGIVVTLAFLFGYSAHAITRLVIGPGRPVLFDGFAALLMALVFGPTVFGLRAMFQPEAIGVDVVLTRVTFNVFCMAVGIFVLYRHLCMTDQGNYLLADDLGAAQPGGEPRLLRRLSDETVGDVLRLSASDHYVEVVTTEGSEVLRLRFADAINEMEPVEGYCVHRSHWVARSAIMGVERESAHKLFLRLSNGDRVPVSRKYRTALEEAGVIKRDPVVHLKLVGRS